MKNTEQDLTVSENKIRSFNILLVITLCKIQSLIYLGCLITVHYFLKLKQLKLEFKAKDYDTLFSSGLYKGLFLELAICSLFDPPYVNSIFAGKMLGGRYTYSLDDMMVVISFAKCYLLIRLYYNYSKWTTGEV
jgi:hypothetical protein